MTFSTARRALASWRSTFSPTARAALIRPMTTSTTTPSPRSRATPSSTPRISITRRLPPAEPAPTGPNAGRPTEGSTVAPGAAGRATVQGCRARVQGKVQGRIGGNPDVHRTSETPEPPG